MSQFASQNDIRRNFSLAMSKMYQQEVPLYSDLMDLVHDVNQETLDQNPQLKQQLDAADELSRLDMERHGAIRLGLPSELATIRRLFAVMGMVPVGYYDLAPSGVPVHSTAFRATDAKDLAVSPFRVFTSLLRLELIADDEVRAKAKSALESRQIFSPRVLELIELYEKNGGLSPDEADEFVQEALKTFRWHKESPIAKSFYDTLHDEHRLIADVVGFKGPHINHLTPRTLDIDAVQAGMASRGIPPKAIIEGPPQRKCPIFLRQTSFKALEEEVKFAESAGTHTARFGEIEQRGVALTDKGRALYDTMLDTARSKAGVPEKDPEGYMRILSESFQEFPDDYRTLHDEGLAYFYYQVGDAHALGNEPVSQDNLKALLDKGVIKLVPMVYEDFLPVSAAGIFQSNLGENGQGTYDGASNQAIFERELGAKILKLTDLYQKNQDDSWQACKQALCA